MRYAVHFVLHPFSLMPDMVIGAIPTPGISGHIDHATGSMAWPDLAELERKLPREYGLAMRRKSRGHMIWFNQHKPEAPAYYSFHRADGSFLNGCYFLPIHAASAAIN